MKVVELRVFILAPVRFTPLSDLVTWLQPLAGTVWSNAAGSALQRLND